MFCPADVRTNTYLSPINRLGINQMSMMVSISKRMLRFVSFGSLLFSSPCVASSPIFSAPCQEPVQQDTILLDAVPRDTAQRVAKGLVENNEGTPLAGVTVSIKGSTVKTQTSEHGTYEIKSQADTTAIDRKSTRLKYLQ